MLQIQEPSPRKGSHSAVTEQGLQPRPMTMERQPGPTGASGELIRRTGMGAETTDSLHPPGGLPVPEPHVWLAKGCVLPILDGRD